jgi:hypothetical protein
MLDCQAQERYTSEKIGRASPLLIVDWSVPGERIPTTRGRKRGCARTSGLRISANASRECTAEMRDHLRNERYDVSRSRFNQGVGTRRFISYSRRMTARRGLSCSARLSGADFVKDKHSDTVLGRADHGDNAKSTIKGVVRVQVAEALNAAAAAPVVRLLRGAYRPGRGSSLRERTRMILLYMYMAKQLLILHRRTS